MGISSITNIAVGFKVPTEALFYFEENKRYSCKHYKEEPTLDNNYKFCPYCGCEIKVYSSKTKKLRPEMEEILDINNYEYPEDAMHNGAWFTQIGDFKLELRELVDNYSGQSNIFVAFWLNGFDPRHDGDSVTFCGDPAVLPKKEIIMKTLDMHQIPYDPESYGIYMLTDWF